MTYLTPEQALDKSLISYLAEQVIAEPIRSIQKLGGGCAWNYDINDHIILKLPQQKSFVQDWENQAKVAPILQKRLDVLIPNIRTKTAFLSGTSGQALTTAQYEKIPGVCIHPTEFHKISPSFKEKYFDQLTDIMLQLHSIPLELFPFGFTTKMEYLQKYFTKRLGEKRGPLVSKVLEELVYNRFFGFNRDDFKGDKLCHSDMHSGNVCLDSKGKIIGILDFDSLTRGDPVLEFRSGLYPKQDMKRLVGQYLKKAPGAFTQKDINRIKHIKSVLLFFYALYHVGCSGAQKIKNLKTSLMKGRN